MNFYTVASKFHKQALKRAKDDFHRMEQSTALGIKTDYLSFDDLYDKHIQACLTEFDQVCNVGVDLMMRFTNKISSIKDTNGERWYFITVRPPNDHNNFILFKSHCEDFCKKWAHKWNECVYVYEQKGETPESAGFGYHWHMRVATNHLNYYKSHILRDLIKMFDYVAPNCIRVESIKNLERCIEYMAGDKKSDAKKPAVLMDSIWREAMGIPASVEYKPRQEVIAIN